MRQPNGTEMMPGPLSNAEERAIDFLAGIGFTKICVQDKRKGGSQSHLTTLVGYSDDGEPAKFLLKVFTRQFFRNSVGTAVAEFEALKLFAAAVATERSVGCPRPMALFEPEWAYLMTYVDGVTLDSFTPPSPEYTNRICTAIARGLAIFYSAVRAPYGELSPVNLLIDEGTGSVYFVDPTYVRIYESSNLQYAPATIDLGFWLAGLSARSPKMMVTRPKEYLRRWAVTHELLRACTEIFAPGNPARFAAEAKFIATQYHRRQFRRKPVRRTVLPAFAHAIMHYQLGKQYALWWKKAQTPAS